MSPKPEMKVDDETIKIDRRRRTVSLEFVLTNAPKLPTNVLQEIKGATLEYLGVAGVPFSDAGNRYRLTVEGCSGEPFLRGNAVQKYILAVARKEPANARQLKSLAMELYKP